ncbi:MAG: O-antigen ligase family protein [Thermoanaerobaculia bacterium]
MARRSGASPHRRTAASEAAPTLPAGLLALTLLAALLVVAPRAEAAFDAPKRLVVAAGLVAVAAAGLLRPGRPETLRAAFRSPAGALLLAGGLLILLSTLLSPRPALSRDALRYGALLALALPVGASSILGGRRALLPALALVVGASANAAAALLAKAGWTPFTLVARPFADGLAAGAFLGNEGLLGIALALAAPVTLALALASATRGARTAFALALVLQLAALLSVRSLTGLLAAVAGLTAVAVATPRLRRPALLALPVVLVAVTVLPPVRTRVVAVAAELRRGDVAALGTYRAGPWAAAVEMARRRPLSGFGPGTFGAEYPVHRLAAERRAGTKLTTPVPYASYGAAHNDLLQAAAELGLPAALAFAGAALLVVVRLARRAASGPEPAALLGLLLAGGVASLAWFPMHRPELALPLLLALGRGLALPRGREEAA